MPYLRSPIVHHVHPQPFHLKQFAKQHQYTNAFMVLIQRPELTMFMNHVHMLLNINSEDCLVQGLVQTLDKQETNGISS